MEKCECACGCDAPATRWDETSWVCDVCGDYYLDDDGEAVCSREQDDRTCRHCDEDIAWGPITTGRPGAPNTRYGACSCRQWSQTDHGGTWRLAEGEAVAQEEDAE